MQESLSSAEDDAKGHFQNATNCIYCVGDKYLLNHLTSLPYHLIIVVPPPVIYSV